MKPKLIVERKNTPSAIKYFVYGTDASGTKGELIASAQRRNFVLKDDSFAFYSDVTTTRELFGFRTEKPVTADRLHIIEDTQRNKIGTFNTRFEKSATKGAWNIANKNDQSILVVKENNKAFAFIRRLSEMVFLSGFAKIIIALFGYHFVFLQPDSGVVMATYKRISPLRRNYVLSMQDETYNTQDGRVLAAMCIALDAIPLP